MASKKEKHSPRALAEPSKKTREPKPGAEAGTPPTSAMATGGATPINAFGAGEGKDALHLVRMVREGLPYPLFARFSAETPFTAAEWAAYLHLSERTIQRYKKEQSTFEPPQTERILEIILLCNQGEQVFGQKEKFNTWLNAESVALGNVKPKELLDSSFGINLLKDELIKIEHGVLA
jgi:putative toxin-antitoxin system antitoxin component (TIGR02293 family)